MYYTVNLLHTLLNLNQVKLNQLGDNLISTVSSADKDQKYSHM